MGVANRWLGNRSDTPEAAARKYLQELDRNTELLDERGADLPMIERAFTMVFQNVLTARGIG